MRIAIILAILVGLAVIAYVQVKMVLDRLIFKFSFRGLGFSGFDWAALVAGQQDAKLLLALNIQNHNSFSIPFDNTKVWLYYENNLVAESSGYLYVQKFNIPAKKNGVPGIIDVPDYVNVYLNSSMTKLAKDTVSGNKPKVNYTVKIRIFKVYITYKDFFEATI